MLRTPIPPAAWCGLEELRPVLRRRLEQSCRDESEVDDLVQETFLRAARYRGSLSDPDKLRAWLLCIARNVHRDHLRREKRYTSVSVGDELLDSIEGREPVPGDAPSDSELSVGRHQVEREVALAELSRALGELRHDDRALLESFYHRGEGARLAARRIDVSPGNVKVRLFRARERLRRAVGRALARERLRLPRAEELPA